MRAELLLAGMLLAAAAAAGEPPGLEVTVEAAALRVGDRLPVRVVARGGDDVLWGELEVAVEPGGGWALVEGPRGIDGAQPPAWELVLAPLELGELALPPIAATVRERDGEGRELVASEPPPVTVTSVLPAEEEVAPRPLRDPVGVSGFPWEWVLPLALPVIGAALGLAWWFVRRGAAGPSGGIGSLPPLDELERLLERLEQRIGREPSAGTCDRLATGLRRFLARESGEPAEDMTSFELRLLARRLGWSENVQRGIQEVMAVADRVRFARMPADEAGLRRTVAKARETAREVDRQLAAAAAAAEIAKTAEAAG